MKGPARLQAASLLLLAAIGVRGQTQTAPPVIGESTLAGVFTAAQAKRGEDTYMSVCVGCHSAGTYVGKSFTEKWDGKPLADLFEIVSEKMPKDDPGGLTPGEYAQVIAYILKRNGLPEGKNELPADWELLKKIKFETPKTGGTPQAEGTKRWHE